LAASGYILDWPNSSGAYFVRFDVHISPERNGGHVKRYLIGFYLFRFALAITTKFKKMPNPIETYFSDPHIVEAGANMGLQNMALLPIHGGGRNENAMSL